MAEINIQEKKHRAVWPWIVGLLLLLLLIWGAMEMMGGDDDDVAIDPVEEPLYPVGQDPAAGGTADPSGTGIAVPAELTQLEQQCGTSGTTASMSTDHSYINNCVTQLSAALDAIVQRDSVNGAAIAPQLQEFRQRAERLTQNAQSSEHSAYVRQVFDGIASLIGDMESARGATAAGAAPRVQQAADAISTDRPVLEQKDAVHAFFDEAAGALRALATR